MEWLLLLVPFFLKRSPTVAVPSSGYEELAERKARELAERRAAEREAGAEQEQHGTSESLPIVDVTAPKPGESGAEWCQRLYSIGYTVGSIADLLLSGLSLGLYDKESAFFASAYGRLAVIAQMPGALGIGAVQDILSGDWTGMSPEQVLQWYIDAATADYEKPDVHQFTDFVSRL